MALEVVSEEFTSKQYYGIPIQFNYHDLSQVFSAYLMVMFMRLHTFIHEYHKYYIVNQPDWQHSMVYLLRDGLFLCVLLTKSAEILTSIWGYGVSGTFRRLYRIVSKRLFRFILSLPGIKSKVDAEVQKNVEKMQQQLIRNDESLLQFHELPSIGLSDDAILTELDKLQTLKHSDWNNGRVSGAVYHGGSQLVHLQAQSFEKYCVANQLHPDVFPGVRKMEAEVVSMVLNMFNAPPGAVGTSTSGGTESLLLTALAAREYGKRFKHISQPEIIAPITIHAGIEKACYYFNIKLHKVELDKSYKVDISRVKRLINRNTILLVGSAPNFPHGIIDDIESLSDLAVKYDIPLHVDCCLGSFIVSFMEKAGFSVSPFDFRLPGVTSISCDTHKYGFAPKGSSIIMYRSSKLRECQYYVSTDWTGGLYGSPTLAGSRPGALMVGCWSTLVNFGEAGYIKSCRDIVTTTRKLKTTIQEKIPELQVIGDPILSVVSFKSSTKSVPIYSLGDKLSSKGWHFSALQEPPALHFAVTKLTVDIIDELIQDLVECVDELKGSVSEQSGDTAVLYGVAGSVQTTGVADRLIIGFLDSLYKI